MLKDIPMLRLLHATFATASLQLAAIVIATLCVLVFAPRDTQAIVVRSHL
jgi:hypothetical protein